MVGANHERKRSHEYELGHADRELERLATQAQLIDPMTRQYFRRAGLAPGMRVLDIGSGAGDVAFLAGDLVGSEGEVVGTDRSPTAVAAAEARARQRSIRNVSFRLGDPADLAFDQPFDAVVGRYVLMFSPNPTEMLRGILRHVRTGGIVVFHEVDWTSGRSDPPAPTYDQCVEWIVRTFERVGSNPRMGMSLHPAFLAAGLPAPTMGLQALIGGGAANLGGADLIADLAVTMAPVMEQSGVVTTTELGPETLRERMRAEVLANGSVLVGRSEIGAWARVPAQSASR